MNTKIISLAQCREIMNLNGLDYTDEELLTIRDFLYRLHEIGSSHFERTKEKEAKVILINENNTNYETKSIPLYQSKHRRAS